MACFGLGNLEVLIGVYDLSAFRGKCWSEAASTELAVDAFSPQSLQLLLSYSRVVCQALFNTCLPSLSVLVDNGTERARLQFLVLLLFKHNLDLLPPQFAQVNGFLVLLLAHLRHLGGFQFLSFYHNVLLAPALFQSIRCSLLFGC